MIITLSSCNKNKETALLPLPPTEKVYTETAQAQSWLIYNCYHEQSGIAIDNSTTNCSLGTMAATPLEHPLELINGLWYLHFQVLHNYPPNIDNYNCRINLDEAEALSTGDEGFYGFYANSILNGVNCETIGIHNIYLGEVTEDYTEIICVFEQEAWDCLCSAPNDLIIPILLDCNC